MSRIIGSKRRACLISSICAPRNIASSSYRNIGVSPRHEGSYGSENACAISWRRQRYKLAASAAHKADMRASRGRRNMALASKSLRARNISYRLSKRPLAIMARRKSARNKISYHRLMCSFSINGKILSKLKKLRERRREAIEWC